MSHSETYGIPAEEFIRLALKEDLGDGDHTSTATINKDSSGVAVVKVKEDGIIAGTDIARMVLDAVDKNFSIQKNLKDGSRVSVGDEIFRIEGNVRNLLLAERLLLNFLQRMSGIATLTRKFVDAVEGTNAKILDTRKTTPNFRHFEKSAVVAGGGFNHRFGLYDQILIKDNHVDAAGGIGNALKKAGEYNRSTGKNLMIEIETRNLNEVEEVIKSGIANRIMLDNFNPQELTTAVKIIDNKFETEASGGITLLSIREYAMTGVNFISVGALTHSFKSMDISMKIIPFKN